MFISITALCDEYGCADGVGDAAIVVNKKMVFKGKILVL